MSRTESERAADLRQSLLLEDDDNTPPSRRKRDSTKRLKRPDSAWYIFDNLSTQQAEDLLRQHGDDGVYLVSRFSDPRSYQLVIRFNDEGGLVFKQYGIHISGRDLTVEGLHGSFTSLEDAIDAVAAKLDLQLTPIFHKYNCETCDFSVSASEDAPPEYSPAQRFPEAPKRKLPFIVPIRPTIQRIMSGRDLESSTPAGVSDLSQSDTPVHRGCCWKLFHTDPAGRWYKPHKAGPVTAVLLVIGWILFLLFFGWIILLALILVVVLVLCAYCLNFVCTGRCSIEDDDDDN